MGTQSPSRAIWLENGPLSGPFLPGSSHSCGPCGPSLRQGSSQLVFTHTVYRVLVMSGKGFIYSTKCFLFILKCSKMFSVWGSIRFRPRSPRWESLNYSAPLYQLFQSWIEDGPFNRVYIWCIPHSWNPSWNLGNGSEWGLFGPSRTCFWKKAILPRLISITLKCIKIVGKSQENS